MGILLRASTLYVPGFIKLRQLRELFKITAKAFGTPMPSLSGLGLDACLEQYALFTRENANTTIAHKAEIPTKDHLYQGAYGLGCKIRAEFRINTLEEALRMSELVYKIIRIDLQGGPECRILIRKCFFSRYYSGEVCRVISSLDEGLLAGISGGGKLRFDQRITEGYDCCRARLSFERNGT